LPFARERRDAREIQQPQQLIPAGSFRLVRARHLVPVNSCPSIRARQLVPVNSCPSTHGHQFMAISSWPSVLGHQFLDSPIAPRDRISEILAIGVAILTSSGDELRLTA
jgi:hypothetical protein